MEYVEAKHEKKPAVFDWSEQRRSSDYYTRRIESLENQLETANNQVALKSRYIEKITEKNLKLEAENEKLRAALIKSALREV